MEYGGDASLAPRCLTFATLCSLPDDILPLIMRNLDGWEAARAACVCRAWRDLIAADEVGWRARFWRAFAPCSSSRTGKYVPFETHWEVQLERLHVLAKSVVEISLHMVRGEHKGTSLVLFPFYTALFGPPSGEPAPTPCNTTTLLVRPTYHRLVEAAGSATLEAAGDDDAAHRWLTAVFKPLHSALRTQWLVCFDGAADTRLDTVFAQLCSVGARWRRIPAPEAAARSWRLLYAAVASKALKGRCRICREHTEARHLVLHVPMCHRCCRHYPTVYLDAVAAPPALRAMDDAAWRTLSSHPSRRQTFRRHKPRASRTRLLAATVDAFRMVARG